jgi:similar to spore coat protein
MKMNPIIEYFTGMDTMTDQVIATDFLISAKNGIINYSLALTETATPKVKKVLRKHLEEAITTHEKISAYMVENGFYHPYHVEEQFQLDLKNAETAINIS